MDHVEVFFNNVYYSITVVTGKIENYMTYEYTDGNHQIDNNKYNLIYYYREDVKFATLILLFSIATFSSLIFLTFFCASDIKDIKDNKDSNIKYISLKKNNKNADKYIQTC